MRMDSLPIGFHNNSEELIKIETELFDVYIEGKPFHPTVEQFQLTKDKNGEYEQADINFTFDEFKLNKIKVYVFNPVSKKLEEWERETKTHPIFFENQIYNLLIENKSDQDISFFHENINIKNAVKKKGKHVLSGNIDFKNEIGFTELVIQLNNIPVIRIRLEIYPVKISYKKDYEQILQEINYELYNLTFDFLKKTYQYTGLVDTKKQSLTEYFSIVSLVYKRLMHAINLISLSPNRKIISNLETVPSYKSKKYSSKTVNYLLKNQSRLIQDNKKGIIALHGNRYTPTHVINQTKNNNYDTNENRFIKWVLTQTSRKLSSLVKLINNGESNKNKAIIKQLESMINGIDRALKFDFLQVGTMTNMTISLVLQMSPNYRDVYKNYLMLQKGLAVENDLFRLSMKDLAELYEYWCFLKIHSLLCKKYTLIKQDIIKIDSSGLFSKLIKSKPSTVKYKNPKNGEVFTLSYNQSIKGPTLSQKPDNVLSLNKDNSSIQYKFVFDAKYKLNPAVPGDRYYNKYGIPGPEEEDINTMHRYRDAIVQAHTPSEYYERTMFGAYVLFPYSNESEFENHTFYKSIEKVNIGAFPLLPGSTTLLEKFLDKIITESPESIYEKGVGLIGTDEYYEYKQQQRNVLVGCMSNEHQLHVALTHKFYHTPLTNIVDHNNIKHIEYVALYQSKRLYNSNIDGIGINYYGKVVGMKIVKRSEITEIASTTSRNNPETLYIVFEVEKWEKRAEPIVPNGYGVKLLTYTSKYIFDRAHEIAELKLHNDEELSIWREARRAGQVKVTLDNPIIDDATSILSIEVTDNNGS